MDLLNILYTPLDVEEVPPFDVERLLAWTSSNVNQIIPNRKDFSRKVSPSVYPWNIVLARHGYKWLHNFEKEFPQLAKYFCRVFGVGEQYIRAVTLLPKKDNFEGVGFWHADPDECGLRIYLQNDDHDKDFLLIKPTIKKYNSREELSSIPLDGIDDERFSNDIQVACPLKPRQAFFLNNVRAIHAAKISNTTRTRIAALVNIDCSFRDLPQPIKMLIQQSYEKYKDLAIVRSD